MIRRTGIPTFTVAIPTPGWYGRSMAASSDKNRDQIRRTVPE